MIFTTWNVNNGQVPDRLDELQREIPSDVVALQETAQPPVDSPSLWNGDMEHKGLSLSSRFPMKHESITCDTSPCIAATIEDSPLGPFNVLAIWAKPTPTYYEDINRTINNHAILIFDRPTVIMGDFNLCGSMASGKLQLEYLDIRFTTEFDLHSAYHSLKRVDFGAESDATLYWRWQRESRFHCDFIFIPGNWLPRLRSVTVPPFDQFNTSDHRPVSCEIV